jgi:hypothetical protein
MPYRDKEKQKEYQKLWAQQQSNEFKKIKYQREKSNKQLMVDKLNKLKLQKGCCELCGVFHPPCCFDFHHIDESKKRSEVSKLASTGHKWETVLEEIEKCVMLCAPCHRKIHSGLLTLLAV